MKINISKNSNNKQANFKQVNLWLNIIVLGLIAMIKVSAFIFYSNIEFNIFDILTIISSIIGIMLSTLYLKDKNELNKETISISCTAISLLLVGFSLLMYNNPMKLHKNIFFIISIVIFLGMFITFSLNQVGLKIDKDEIPNIKLNLIMSMIGAAITITLIIITNYISKKYYNDSLTIFIGSIAVLLASIYSMVAAINIKKIRRGIK